MRIVITDCDHDAFDEERAVVEASGDELIIANATDPAALIANARGADALVVQYASITAEILDALPQVKVVSRYGVGVDSVDIPAATARGVAVCNVPDYGTEAVSDHAIALALNAAREVARLDRGLRDGRVDFPGVRPMHLIGGRVFGILGLGLIGSATARKAAGLGFEVICHDIAAGDASEFRGYPHVSLPELLSRSQVISIHTPLTDLTRHLIDADALASMRSDAIVVNTARGPIVDTAALGEALRNGQIRGAALDVTETEPLPADDPLLNIPQLTVTPHMAWYSEESYGELKRRTVENAVDVAAGRTPRNIVNPEVLGAPGRNHGLTAEVAR